MTGYITKYALTKGIIETELTICSSVSNGSMVEAPNLGIQCFFHGEGRDWHRSRQSAIARANAMKAARLCSLRKAIKTIEAKTFD